MRIVVAVIFWCWFASALSAQAVAEWHYGREAVEWTASVDSLPLPRIYRGIHTAETLQQAQAILGRYEGHRFYPLVPFSYEQDYTFVASGLIEHFRIDLPQAYVPLEIIAIHPSAPDIPANTLKWYIQFNKPVSSANIYDHFRLLDSEGAPVERAILRLESALLNEAKNTLTIWIEPGRQKRGLGPNERLGAVFEEGRSYRLIAEGMRDREGVRMAKEWQHDFRAIAADRHSPQPSNWQLRLPPAGSSTPLYIHCGEAMDYGSTRSGLQILDHKGSVLKGKWKLENDRQLSFTPRHHWPPGAYTLKIAPTVEDIAGNNPLRLFDQDLSEGNRTSKNPILDIPFKITSGQIH